jgi:hypothetical protein
MDCSGYHGFSFQNPLLKSRASGIQIPFRNLHRRRAAGAELPGLAKQISSTASVKKYSGDCP